MYWLQVNKNEDSKEIVLYDFNAKVNDTIYQLIVTKIDTVKILHISRERISLRNCSNQYEWIEGIGDMSDILSYSSRPFCDYKKGIVGDVIGGSGFKQTCVLQGSELIYKDADSNDCWH